LLTASRITQGEPFVNRALEKNTCLFFLKGDFQNADNKKNKQIRPGFTGNIRDGRDK
jgi:hypothetical protein